MHILHTLKVEQINLQYSHTIPRHLSSKQRKPRGLLVIDDGSSRDLITARILQQPERAIGKLLWDIFDFGGAVSTGGLLIFSSLVRRTPSDKLVQMYEDMCGEIFSSRVTRLSEYSAKPLGHQLKNHFSDLRMVRSNGKGPHVFVVTKRNYHPESYLLRNYPVPDDLDCYKGEAGWLCSDVARATTAASTFFTPHRRDDNHYSDSAMGFDNPTQLLFDGALSLLSKSTQKDAVEHRSMPRIDYIVSIGPGKMGGWGAPVGAPKTGLPRVLETVQSAVELLTDFENSHLEMQMLTKAYGNIPYFRLNPSLPERLPLDMLVGLTEFYLGDVASGIPKQIDRLSELLNIR